MLLVGAGWLLNSVLHSTAKAVDITLTSAAEASGYQLGWYAFGKFTNFVGSNFAGTLSDSAVKPLAIMDHSYADDKISSWGKLGFSLIGALPVGIGMRGMR